MRVWPVLRIVVTTVAGAVRYRLHLMKDKFAQFTSAIRSGNGVNLGKRLSVCEIAEQHRALGPDQRKWQLNTTRYLWSGD